MRASDDHKEGVVEVLARRHPLFARVTIDRWVGRAFDSYRSAPVQTFVPILAQREVDALLRDLEAVGPGQMRPATHGNGQVASAPNVVYDTRPTARHTAPWGEMRRMSRPTGGHAARRNPLRLR